MKRLLTLLTLLVLAKHFALGQMKPDWQFRDELMAHLIDPKDTVYIEDRQQLERLSGLQATDSTAVLNGVTKAGEKIVVSLRCGTFEPGTHKLDLMDTVYKYIHNEKRVDYINSKDLIDGKRAYGIDGSIPYKEIRELRIKWKDSWLIIPDSAVQPFYEIHPQTMEAYVSRYERFIYIYLQASDGAGAYSVKFVFDKKGFVTRLISTNECTNGFDFIDALPQDCEETEAESIENQFEDSLHQRTVVLSFENDKLKTIHYRAWPGSEVTESAAFHVHNDSLVYVEYTLSGPDIRSSLPPRITYTIYFKNDKQTGLDTELYKAGSSSWDGFSLKDKDFIKEFYYYKGLAVK